VVTVLLCAGLGGFAGRVISVNNPGDGWLYDVAIAVSGRITEAAPLRDPVAVILVDAPSLAAKELSPYPRALFGPIWAQVLDAVFAAEARVVAFDALLRFSGNRFKSGHDRAFLKQLHANKERVVLGRSARAIPVAPYLAALGFDEGGLGLLELRPDGDGVIRRGLREFLDENGVSAPTLVTSTLLRMGVKEIPETTRMAPQKHLLSIPHYSLIDVLRCANTSPELLTQAFRGRLVFIGTGLAEEDRKISPGRYLPKPSDTASPLAVCGGRENAPPEPVQIATVPGVFLHAEVAREIITGRLVKPPTRGTRTAVAVVAAAAGALIGLFAPLSIVLLPMSVGVAALFALEVWLLGHNVWLAAATPILVFLLGAIAAYLVRYLLEDRRRRRIENAFGHFLAPAIVSQLSESDAPLKLGGEASEITVMFADLSGFTALSTQVSAQELVEVTNRYLARVTDAIESSGGYVDKFIGDAVMAFWGAPSHDEDHGPEAVAAALAIRDDIIRDQAEAQRDGRTGFDIKIGLYSGPAVVGMMGSPQRLNYTAVGESVNVASRLEGVPPLYGVRVVLGDSTAGACEDRFLMRQLDTITVKGRDEPLTVYEPLAPSDAVSEAIQRLKDGYEAALDLYRRGNLEEARKAWLDLAANDPAAQIMADRCADLARDLPPDWDGIWRLSEK
jgi:class 3 adenylate cyclase